MNDGQRRGVACAILAAAFYALNSPLSKLLLGDVAPTMMAAFLYLGAGLGMAAHAQGTALYRRDGGAGHRRAHRADGGPLAHDRRQCLAVEQLRDRRYFAHRPGLFWRGHLPQAVGGHRAGHALYGAPVGAGRGQPFLFVGIGLGSDRLRLLGI